MPLEAGARLGPYEVLSALGAGGMGEVYRARDTKLNRDVALKVLPELFGADPDRVARFEREAQLLAALNHPNIAQIYGLEGQVGREGQGGGALAIAMELVEGETLAEKLQEVSTLKSQDSRAQRGLPLDEALAIAKQIAEGLEAAHEQGIIHRDLKPANIKVRPDGTVKVLDFGLAKMLDPVSAEGIGQKADAHLTASPTMTSPALMTGAGMILGTAVYMSPEQARGKSVDRRADIWAFGAVLYEMLTGTRAFAGDSVTDIAVAVMTKEPDWSVLPGDVPPPLVALLRRCLKKDSRERLRDIGDARLELADVRQASPVERPPVGSRNPRGRRAGSAVAIGAAIGLAIGIAATIAYFRRGVQPPTAPGGTSGVVRMAINLPADAPVALDAAVPPVGYESVTVAVSPDGRYVAYVGQANGVARVYLREMSQSEVKAIPGTEGAIYSFFSPDSRWLGFLTNDKVKKVSLSGGAPVVLCDARESVRATWTPLDAIYFDEGQGARMSRVAAAGGAVSTVPAPIGILSSFSQVLPDGQHALGTVRRLSISKDFADVVEMSFATGKSKVLVQSGYDARFVPPNHLLFGRGGGIFAVTFDPVREAITGEPVPIVTNAAMDSLFSQLHMATSDTGILAYVPGSERAEGRLAWIDRQHRTEFLPIESHVFGVLQLSPNGDRLATSIAGVTDYVWIYDFSRREGRKFTSNESAGWPVWSPDGKRIAYSVAAGDRWRVVARPVEGGDVQEIAATTVAQEEINASSWSPDGRTVAIEYVGRDFHRAYFTFGGGLEQPAKAGGDEWGSEFSPDGRWVAYSSTQTGQSEIVVRSYPDGKISRQVSVAGGMEPRWCRCGELFYRVGNRWMSTRIRTTPALQWDPPQLAFETDFIDTPGRSYDVSPDGKRLLVVKRANTPTHDRIDVVLNWPMMLKK